MNEELYLQDCGFVYQYDESNDVPLPEDDEPELVVGDWIVIGTGVDADYGKVLEITEKGALVAFECSCNHELVPAQYLGEAEVYLSKPSAHDRWDEVRRYE